MKPLLATLLTLVLLYQSLAPPQPTDSPSMYAYIGETEKNRTRKS